MSNRMTMLVAAVSLAAACAADPGAELESSLTVDDPWLEYGVRDEDGQRWAYIRDRATGDDLIAAPMLGPDVGYDALQIFGHTQADLELLDPAAVDHLVRRLDQPAATQAARLWQEIETDPERRVSLWMVAILSELFMYLIENLPRGAADGWVANGCTWAPDFDFKDCCDAHDACYCAGGIEADRQACDEALRDCIRAKGHRILAAIYYASVRALGAPYFNYR